MSERVLMMMVADWWMYKGVMVMMGWNVLKLGDICICVDGVTRGWRRPYWLLGTWWTERVEM